MKRLLWHWRSIPPDARWTIIVAALMPIVIHLYHAAPLVAGWLGTQDVRLVARAMFSLSFGFGAIVIGHLIERGGGKTRDNLRIFVGHAITAAGMVTAAFAVLALRAPLMLPDNQVMTWRLLTGMSQAILVLGWLVLWRVRRRWLSHQAAGVAALTSAAGLALYCVANFLVVDPLTTAWGWGVIHPRSLVARITGIPWIEPMIAAVLWIGLGLLLRRWWLKADGGGSASQHR